MLRTYNLDLGKMTFSGHGPRALLGLNAIPGPAAGSALSFVTFGLSGARDCVT